MLVRSIRTTCVFFLSAHTALCGAPVVAYYLDGMLRALSGFKIILRAGEMLP